MNFHLNPRKNSIKSSFSVDLVIPLLGPAQLIWAPSNKKMTQRYTFELIIFSLIN